MQRHFDNSAVSVPHVALLQVTSNKENVKSKILFIMHMPLPVYGTGIGLFQF